MYGWGSGGPMQRGPHARSNCARLATLAALASTPSAAHFLKSHQLLVQKFAADRNRQRSSFEIGTSPFSTRETGPIQVVGWVPLLDGASKLHALPDGSSFRQIRNCPRPIGVVSKL